MWREAPVRSEAPPPGLASVPKAGGADPGATTWPSAWPVLQYPPRYPAHHGEARGRLRPAWESRRLGARPSSGGARACVCCVRVCVVWCVTCACVLWERQGGAVGGRQVLGKWPSGDSCWLPARLATGKNPWTDRVAGSKPPSVAEGPSAKPTTAPREGGSWQEVGGLSGPCDCSFGVGRGVTQQAASRSWVCSHGEPSGFHLWPRWSSRGDWDCSHRPGGERMLPTGSTRLPVTGGLFRGADGIPVRKRSTQRLCSFCLLTSSHRFSAHFIFIVGKNAKLIPLQYYVWMPTCLSLSASWSPFAWIN